MSYSVEQVAVLTKAAEIGPITWAKAHELAEEVGMSPRSVVAKIKSLELPYEPKPVAPKRPKGLTKTDLVRSIEARLGEEFEGRFNGLEKATAQSLNKLLEAL